MHEACPHAADAIADVPPPLEVCEACVEIGSTWVHLRQCRTCGRTLCCNDSPNRHMTAHYGETGHPVMRGAGPGEQWTWCFPDEAMIRDTGDGWETYDPFLDAGMTMAARHLGTNGDPRPAEDYLTRQGFPLGEWFAYVREEHERGDLDPRDVAELEAIPGWTW